MPFSRIDERELPLGPIAARARELYFAYAERKDGAKAMSMRDSFATRSHAR
jgi:hypothetical protein